MSLEAPLTYFKFEGLKKKSEVEVLVTQLCPILCDPMDCSLSGSFGILQARILGLVFKVYKQLMHSIPEKQTTQSKRGKKGLNRYFSKEDIWMANT